MSTTYDSKSSGSRKSLTADDVMVDDAPLLANGSAASSRNVWPASGHLGSSFGTWQAIMNARIVELAVRPEGWDGYRAARLQPAAVDSLLRLLETLDPFIGRAPVVSLTPDGGLLCAWSSGTYSLDLESDGEGRLSAYFVDHLASVEHDVEVPDGQVIDKWVWQAASPF